MPLTPEQQARVKIDGQLEACGWVVQDFASMNIHAGRGVAVREFPLRWTDGTEIRSGFADYLLYVDGWAVGVIEAKPAGHTLQGVVVQSKRYTEGLDEQVPARYRPLPFAYESTGEVTQFTNGLDPDPRSREIFTFHRPEELLRLQDLGSEQLRRLLRKMPELPQGKLWPVQHEAIANLEQSLSHARPRALIQMATGSGKTFTAVSACHRLIKYAKAKRILFLVDRNNLGRQTLNEFQQFRDPSSAYTFSEEFVVQHLSGNAIDPASKVVITTIQRLYSILKGDPEYDSANEDESLFESAQPPSNEPVPVEYTPDVPPEMFDFIVIDECHRSIYNVWRQVIEYFDAFLVGLTATPSPHTIGFFSHTLEPRGCTAAFDHQAGGRHEFCVVSGVGRRACLGHVPSDQGAVARSTRYAQFVEPSKDRQADRPATAGAVSEGPSRNGWLTGPGRPDFATTAFGGPRNPGGDRTARAYGAVRRSCLPGEF